jgi:hypothetical protein
MSWKIDLPFFEDEPDAPLHFGHIADVVEGIENEGRRAVTRELLEGLSFRPGVSTFADAIDLLERSDDQQRRELLDRARQKAGLETTGEVERREAVARLIKDDPPRPAAQGPQRDQGGRAVQVCAEPGCETFAPGDGSIGPVAAKKWWCRAHQANAAEGDLDPWSPPPVRMDPVTGLPKMTEAAERHYRELGERKKREREAKDREDRERREQDAERLAKVERDYYAARGPSLPPGWQ